MEGCELIDYIVSSGNLLTKQTATEWAGPCPFCGGDDRFRVLTSGGRGETGHYFCRQCGKRGDLISWKIEVEGQSYREATGGNAPRWERRNKSETRAKQVSVVSDSSCSETWSAQAERSLSSAWQEMSGFGAAEFFHDGRGLDGATCKALGFGWQSADAFTASELWGLPEGKKVVVPAGAVLPVHRAGRVVALLVRRSKPYSPPGSNKPLWFHEVRGGARGVPFLCGPLGAPLVACESVLCAASVHQVSKGRVAALASLGATKKGFDSEAVDFLKQATVVLIVADDDEAGTKLKETVWAVRPDAYACTIARDENGNPYQKPNGKAAKDINDLLQVWRDDKKVFGWLASRFKRAEAAQQTATVAPLVAGCTPKKEQVAGKVAGNDPKKERAAETCSSSPAEPEPCEPSSVGSSSSEDEAGPDEFAAHVEQVRAAWPDGAPMQCQDVPDWASFCSGWWRDCFVCPYYDGNSNESPCTLWEAAFPGVVRWYLPGAAVSES